MKALEGFFSVIFVIAAVLVMGIVGIGLFTTTAGQYNTTVGCDTSFATLFAWCDPSANQTLTIDDRIAFDSTEALSCAIGVVGSGETARSCLKTFGPAQTVTAGFDIPLVSAQLSPNNPIVTCSSDGSKCAVKNFELPQNVNNAEKWIAGYGDPKYKVYWQSFPHDEARSWEGFATWFDNVVTVAIFAVPFGAGVRGTKNALLEGGRTIVAGGKELAKDSLTRTGKRIIDKISRKAVKEENELAVIAWVESTTRQQRMAAIRAGMPKLLENMGDAFSKRYAGKEARDVLVAAGVSTPVALAAAIMDSIHISTQPIPGNLMIKKPFNDPTPFDLDLENDETIKQVAQSRLPVILNKDSTFGKTTSFYLASPCSADLDVEVGTAQCGQYTYNEQTKQVSCNDIDIIEDEEDVPLCDFSNTGILASSFGETTFHNFAIDLLKDTNSRELYDYDSDKLKKINFPVASQYLGTEVFIDDISIIKEEQRGGKTTKSVFGGTTTSPASKFIKYRGTLNYDGKSKAPLAVQNDTHRLIEKDQDYVVHIYEHSPTIGFDDVIIDVYHVGTCQKGIMNNEHEPAKDLDCKNVLDVWNNNNPPETSTQFIKDKVLEADEKGEAFTFPFRSTTDLTPRDLINKDAGFDFGTFQSSGTSCEGADKDSQCFRTIQDIQLDIDCQSVVQPSQTVENLEYSEWECRIKPPANLYPEAFKSANSFDPLQNLPLFRFDDKNKNIHYLLDGDTETGHLYKQRMFIERDYITGIGLTANDDDNIATISMNIPTGIFSSTLYSVSDFDFNGEKDAFATSNCKIPSVIVTPTMKDTSEDNFCHSKIGTFTKTVIISTIIADIILIAASPTTGAVITAGLLGGGAYVLASSYEEWPN